MANPVEVWKAEKHPLDVWSDVEHHAAASTAMDQIPTPDLERMKWHGFFYRKRDSPGRYMNRIRITANELTADQAREVAFIAYEYGHGIVDVTTRANLQIQGLEIAHVPKVVARLEKVGLTSKQTGHDNIRNVFGHPFSGLVSDEVIDTRSLCRDVDTIFVGNREFSDLPRKLNICFSGSAQHPAHYWTQDLSFLAAKNPDGGIGFQVLLAGTQGQNPRLAWHLPVFVDPEQVVPLTAAIIQLFREKGSREKRNQARLRFLVEDIGIGGVLEWLEQALEFPLEPSINEPVPAAVNEEFVGWFPQRDSRRWIMGLSVPLGRLTWRQLEGLALLSRKWGSGQLRTTQDQGMAVVDIKAGFRGAAATDAAALGLSLNADDYDRNTMACTGSQFCNIAVTETKGHMFQLIDRLRKRSLKLHGIRIHMSGCPSSCAQHFTADIGLKGVRVRRVLGTREGFDIYLGGGLAGQVHLGLPYRLGVDADQLPQLIAEVTQEYYLRHKPGQTFSSYWRERLRATEAEKVGDSDYIMPTWICDACHHEHRGEDPPVFCPGCAGLRRLFARVDSEEVGAEAPVTDDSPGQPAVRPDGFLPAAAFDDIPAQSGLTVQLQGREYALFRHDSGVKCIDAACPHEGASLADGEMRDGVVSCPWHDWTFNVCSGCSLEPPGHSIGTYETKVEDGQVLVRVDAVTGKRASAGISASDPAAAKSKSALRGSEPNDAALRVLQVIDETPDVRTFRLDNGDERIPFDFAGQFVRVGVSVDGETVWRSFTISSSPTHPSQLDLTIRLNPGGTVTPVLFRDIAAGSTLRIRGAQGRFCFDPHDHPEPLVLISAGSGITPMMSITRFVQAMEINRPVTFLFGARTAADIIFHDECRRLAATTDWFRYVVSLSQPPSDWDGECGRVSPDTVRQQVSDVREARYFLCGPNDFMDVLRAGLFHSGVPEERIHTEQFHAARAPVTVQ